MLNPKERLYHGEEGRKLFDLASCKNVEVIFDPDLYEGKYTPEKINEMWLEARRTYVGSDGKRHYTIGGSDQAAIQGISPWTTNVDLFKIKTGKIVSNMDLDKPSNYFRLEWGHAVEELVILGYLATHPNDRVIVDKRTFRRKDKPWLIFDVDGIIIYSNGEVGVFECKSTTYFNKEEWESIPPHYMCQLQHYMGCADIKRATIACCWGNNIDNDLVSFDTKADADYIKRIFDDSERFVKQCEADEEPKLEVCFSNTDLALKSIANYFSDINTSTEIPMPVNDENKDQLLEIQELQKRKDILQKELKMVENSLQISCIPFLEKLKEKGGRMGAFPLSEKEVLRLGMLGRKTSYVDLQLVKDKYPHLTHLIKESMSVTDFRKCGDPNAIAECLKKKEGTPKLTISIKKV